MAYELFYVVIQNKRRRLLSIFESSFCSQNIITLPASSVRSIYTLICFKQIIKQILTFLHTRITNVLNKRYLPSAQLRPRKLQTTECFHSRGQHLCKFVGTKESVCIRKEFNSHRTVLGHQHGRCFIV